jgi:hypothetical protein
MARPEAFAHIPAMADRPCKPDADLKRLWRALLPGTPFPACGAPEVSDAVADEGLAPATDLPDDAARRSERSAGGR